MSDANESVLKGIGQERLLEAARAMLHDRLLHAVKTGQIDLSGLTDDEAATAARTYAIALNEQAHSPGWTLSATLDHRPGLLEKARSFAEHGDIEIAALFYATWVEHWANNLIQNVLRRRQLDARVCEQIVRDTNLKPKLSWLLQLLGLLPLADEDRAACEKIAEFRNGFVHYKWKSKSGDELRPPDLCAALDGIAAAVPRLLAYESMVLHGDPSFATDAEARVGRVLDILFTPQKEKP
jgi:hypothetical protein